MNWLGKVLGTIFGFFLFGPIGSVVGFLAGHFFDQGLKFNWRHYVGNQQATQQVFFSATFAVMGHVAKADGRVSEREIQLARIAMQRLNLHGERQLTAMHEFNRGKANDFNLAATLDYLRKVCPVPHLLRLFFELQVQTAYADGNTPSTQIKNLLQYISDCLNLGKINFAPIDSMLYGQWRQQSSYQQRSTTAPHTNLNDAYEILNVKSTATDEEIKKAYRRKMNENHPDKLMAKGLPKEMIELATEKTQQIQTAYEQIKIYRKIK